MTTAHRDCLAVVLAAIFFCAGLAIAKLADWIEASWWLIAFAPIFAFALEAIIFLPVVITSSVGHFWGRRSQRTAGSCSHP